MARPKGSHKATPSYRLHRATGQAVVTLSGKDHYLGKHESAESWAKYYRLLAQWKMAGRQVAPTTDPMEVTVNEIISAFWLANVVPKYGDSEDALGRWRLVLRPMREMFGDSKACDFASKAYRTIREHIIIQRRNRSGQPLTVKTVNSYMWGVKECIRWATDEELIPASGYHALLAVKKLQVGKNQGGARQPGKVLPVNEADYAAVLPLLPQMVQDICRIMRLTGARCGEIVRMRRSDIDMSGTTWVYSPAEHKTQYLGHKRIIPIGPKAQAIVRPYLTLSLNARLFPPYMDGRKPLEENECPPKFRRKGRKYATTLIPKRKSRRRVRRGDHITTNALQTWVRAACIRADDIAHAQRPDVGADVQIVGRWHVHQLRHSRATELNKLYGVEGAKAVCGHRDKQTTEGYIQEDADLAIKIMGEVG